MFSKRYIYLLIGLLSFALDLTVLVFKVVVLLFYLVCTGAREMVVIVRLGLWLLR